MPAPDNPQRFAVEGGLLVAFDGRQHGLVPGGTLIVDGDRVEAIASETPADIERRIPAHGRLVLPGFINLEACTYLDVQGFATDAGHPNYFGPSGFNFAPTLEQLGQTSQPDTSEADARTSAAYGFLQALQGGATTVVGADYGDVHPDYADMLLDAAAELGVRAYVAPAFGAATHYVTAEGGGDFHWDEARGRKGLQRNVAFAERAARYRADNPGADVHAMLFPYRADAMNEALLRETKAAAADAGVRIRMHAAQFLMEFYEQIRRTSETPIEFLDRVGFLGDDLLVHHAILTAEHSWIPKSDGRDIDLLAESGTSVGHCPTIFARRALMLESFAEHRRRGVNIGLGTDTVPQDMLMVMRWAASLCKIAENNVNTGTAAEMLDAATLAGARALGRTDIGRLEPGAKADFLIVRVDALRSGPLEDPLRNLVNCATSADIASVWVGGRQVVEEGRVLGVDHEAVMATMSELFERKRSDLEQRSARHAFPPSLPVWDELPKR